MKNFLALNDEDRKEMLESISVNSVEDLFKLIPNSARTKEFNLADAMSEMQVQKNVGALAKKNNTNVINFLGAGVYNHFIPACVPQTASRFEFLTAYTPYQPEISQGTLQIMYEYQSMICNLTGMDVANASVYDGASACAEAILMASRVTKREKVLVSEALNPQYKEVIKTYCRAIGIEIEWVNLQPSPLLGEGARSAGEGVISKIKSGEYACVLIQTPNFYGEIEDVELCEVLEASRTLFAVCVNISSLSVLKAPSEYGADIVVGDIQPLGIPMSFGGPHAGFMACREKLMRQMPGRIAGRTLDSDGQQAFTLTIQTREQHIKREKATSNICSNQALIALCATLYLSVLGEKGFKQVGITSSKNAHDLSEMLANKGIKILNKDFYNEFVIEVDNADKFLADLRAKNIIGGLKLDEKHILVATTEMNSEEDLELYCS